MVLNRKHITNPEIQLLTATTMDLAIGLMGKWFCIWDLANRK
jgi:hypothetical protein